MTNVEIKVSARFNKYKVYLLFLILQKRVVNCMIMDEEKQKGLKKVLLEKSCHFQGHE